MSLGGRQIDVTVFVLHPPMSQGPPASALGRTPLDRALSKGHYDVAQLLLDYGANANDQDEVGLVPLHRASEAGDLAAARLLLERGANVDLRDKRDCAPLHLASQHGRVEVVQELLNGRNDVNAQKANLFTEFTPLHEAAYWGRLQVMEVLLKHGADPHIRNWEGCTPSQVVTL